MSTPPRTEAEQRVECWVRSLARVPDGPQGRVVSRLEWLVTDDRLDTLAVETWPAAVPVDRGRLLGSHERAVHERLRAFEQWADRHGRVLGPGFEEREIGKSYVETPVERVRTLPAVALAEYREGELVRVTPSVDEEDGLDTVEEHLEDLVLQGEIRPANRGGLQSANGD